MKQKVRIRTAAQMRKQLADERAARKAKKVTVREVIELLAKTGDWDAEVRGIMIHNAKLLRDTNKVYDFAMRIDAVTSTKTGVLLVLDSED